MNKNSLLFKFVFLYGGEERGIIQRQVFKKLTPAVFGIYPREICKWISTRVGWGSMCHCFTFWNSFKMKTHPITVMLEERSGHYHCERHGNRHSIFSSWRDNSDQIVSYSYQIIASSFQIRVLLQFIVSINNNNKKFFLSAWNLEDTQQMFIEATASMLEPDFESLNFSSTTL